jgi:hypothetical protein
MIKNSIYVFLFILILFVVLIAIKTYNYNNIIYFNIDDIEKIKNGGNEYKKSNRIINQQNNEMYTNETNFKFPPHRTF